MDQLEALTQKHINNFCKTLPELVNKWKEQLEEAQKCIKPLENYSEQLCLLEKCNLKNLDNFDFLQNKLLFSISTEIDIEITKLRQILEPLNNITHELKNKLSTLEKSTIKLDWDSNTLLIIGSGRQPPLAKILQGGWKFSNFFSTHLKLINECFKQLDVRKIDTITNFKQLLDINLTDVLVTYFLAITQYIVNEDTLNLI